MRIRRAFLLIFALLALSGGMDVLAADPAPIRFGVIGTENKDSLRAIWTPIVEDMGRALGRPAEAVIFGDYAGVVWGLRSGGVEIAWMGNKSAIEAVDKAGAEVFVKAIEEGNETGYHALILVPTESALKNVDDLIAKGPELTFGIGDPNSTSGFLAPMSFIFDARGIEPAALFKRVTQGNHEKNFLAIAAGAVDAATSNTAEIRRFKVRFPEMKDKVRAIWTSPLIPSDPLVRNAKLPTETKAALDRFFLEYGRERPGVPAEKTAAEQRNLAALKWTGFVASDNRQLIPVRIIDLRRKRASVAGDATLSADEKTPRLRELDEKLQTLESGAGSVR